LRKGFLLAVQLIRNKKEAKNRVFDNILKIGLLVKISSS